MPGLGEEVLMDEQIHARQEDAEAGVGMVPAHDHGALIGVAFPERIGHVAPAFRRVGDARALHDGVLGDDAVDDVNHVAAVRLLLRLAADHDPGHLAVEAAEGVGLHGPQWRFIEQNVDGRAARFGRRQAPTGHAHARLAGDDVRLAGGSRNRLGCLLRGGDGRVRRFCLSFRLRSDGLPRLRFWRGRFRRDWFRLGFRFNHMDVFRRRDFLNNGNFCLLRLAGGRQHDGLLQPVVNLIDYLTMLVEGNDVEIDLSLFA